MSNISAKVYSFAHRLGKRRGQRIRLLALNMNAKRSTNNHAKEASDCGCSGKGREQHEESKTIKGCAWLATDDSQTGGQKEQAQSGGRVGEGRGG